ncbi:MAG TPA: hypothetical protein VI968_02820 [archaeon]|nr:hypothetical protein [archaeon]
MKSIMIILALVAAIIIFLSSFIGFNATGNAIKMPENRDDFAKCLSDNGARLWGTYWCSFTNSQKQMFGSSWQYVNYTECSLSNKAGQTLVCNQTGIEAYPTWEFKNGERIEGVLSFEELSNYTNCQLE